ncbi:MAG: PEP-CTERM sorting domain-containing protein [Kiritimatiellae bacterium]|nr:PEP-CTERM sorting domain-containing protein [Kiritimatiellia bacterium]
MSIKVAVITLFAMVLSVTAGPIGYDSNAETSGNQWLYGPDSGGAYGSGLDTYVGGGGAHAGMVTFYDGVTPLGTANFADAGYIYGTLNYDTAPAGSTISAVATITAGTYSGYYYNLNSQLIVSPDPTVLTGFYSSGGTNPDGSGWVVPEPGTWALFGLGLMTLVGTRLRRRR